MLANKLEILAKRRKEAYFYGFDFNHCGNYELKWARYPERSCLIDAKTCEVIRCKIVSRDETDQPNPREIGVIADRIRYLTKVINRRGYCTYGPGASNG